VLEIGAHQASYGMRGARLGKPEAAR